MGGLRGDGGTWQRMVLGKLQRLLLDNLIRSFMGTGLKSNSTSSDINGGSEEVTSGGEDVIITRYWGCAAVPVAEMGEVKRGLIMQMVLL